MSAAHDHASTFLVGLPRRVTKGTILADKYRIDALLAEGGMGLVYLGWHLLLDQPVAIKLVRPELAHRPDAAERFLNEARAVARLRGPNVARVLDSGRMGNGQLYMVFEYLDGADLRTVLENEGPLSLPRAVDYVLQVLEAMAEAHQAGIVHRDLKPENLFLTQLPDGTELIKVLDFGISKRLDNERGRSQTIQGQNLGSPHYMAPEQVSTPGDVDTRADIWSLGVVLFELLTGRVPFDGDTVLTVCAQVLGRDPTPARDWRPDLPREVEAAIQRCLRKKANDRFATVADFAQAIAPFGSAASGALKRIRRVSGIAPVGNELALHVDVDLSELHPDERTPMPRVFAIPHEPVTSRWRAFLPLAAALLVGALGAVALPQSAIVSDALGTARERIFATFGPAAAHTESSLGAAALDDPASSKPPTTLPAGGSKPIVTPIAAAPLLDIDLDAVAQAPRVRSIPAPPPAPAEPRDDARSYRPAPPPAPARPSAPAPASRPPSDVDRLMAPYDGKARPASGDFSFRTPSSYGLDTRAPRGAQRTSSAVDSP